MSYEARDNKFPFEEEVIQRFMKWTGISDPDISESLKDLTGDTYFEMRKLISQLLTEIETSVTTGQYCGYLNGKELTEDEKSCIKEVKEDMKEFVRISIEATWRSILNKQKIGIDKLSLSLKPYIKVDEDEENNLESSDN